MQSNEYVQFFDGGIEPKLENLGGKGASLVTMTSAGMPVRPASWSPRPSSTRLWRKPALPGISTSCSPVWTPKTWARWTRSPPPSGRTSAPARAAGMRELTVAAYEALMSRFEAPVPVAVRSSATAEDLPDASFAGQQDTYLWVVGVEAVTEHIRQCWASLFTSRAIIYRRKNDIPNEGLSMAVVVQRMVDARVSGVAITLDPANGDRSKITIDSSYGVGEMVVSGQVTPDNIMLDKVMLTVVSEHLGDKHAELVADAVAGRLVEREVDDERRGRRSLSDAELTAVAQLAKRAEKHYECPQDIEWALDADLPDGETCSCCSPAPRPCTPPSRRSALRGRRRRRLLHSGASASRVTCCNPLKQRFDPLVRFVTQAQRRARTERTAMSMKSFPKPSDFRSRRRRGLEGALPVLPALPGQAQGARTRSSGSPTASTGRPSSSPSTRSGSSSRQCLGQYNTRHLMIPPANGIDYRVHNGYLYMSPVARAGGGDRRARAAVPRARGPLLRQLGPLLENWHVKIRHHRRAGGAWRSSRCPRWSRWRTSSPAGARTASRYLLESYNRLIELAYQAWQYHFEFLNLGYAAYLDFFGFCKEAFPGIPDRRIAKMVQGIEVDLFRPDDELKQLAKLAVELGVAGRTSRNTGDVEATLAAVAAAAGGDRVDRRVGGGQGPVVQLLVGHGFYSDDKVWLDHLEIPLGFIATTSAACERGRGHRAPDRGDRRRARPDHRASTATLLDDEDARGVRREARAAAARCSRTSRTTTSTSSTGPFGVLAQDARARPGARRRGLLAEADDIFYLRRDEVRDVLFDLGNGWARRRRADRARTTGRRRSSAAARHHRRAPTAQRRRRR